MSTFNTNSSTEEQVTNDQSVQTQSTESQPFFQVGDRVFKTPEDLAKHVQASQEHIKKLEKDFESASSLVAKQDELLAKSSRVDELLEVYKQGSSVKAEDTTSQDKGEIIAEALRAFEQKQQQMTIAQQREQNFKTVADALTKVYGDKVDEMVAKVASENGISFDEAIDMSGKHPKVFLKMFDLSNKSDARLTTGSVNSTAVATTPAQQPTKSIMKMSAKERAAYIQRRLLELP